MGELLKGFINGPKFIGGIVLKGIRYIGIGCYTILTNKLTLCVLVISLIMGVIQVSTGYREEILRQEQEMMMVDEETSINYYYDDVSQVNYGESMAITDMIKCYQANVNLDSVPDSMVSLINKLDNLYNSSSKYFSFLYHDLFSGFTVEYNAASPIFTASTIKAPAMIYIYEMASLGMVDLNEKLVYTRNFYHGGSGVLKNKAYDTEYTVEELLQYTIYDSDNIAYKMLMNRFGQINIREFWRGKGTNNIFELNTIWGYMSANEAMIYMKELYRFSKDNEEYGSKLLEHFKKAKWKQISNKDGEYNTANKGGWSGTAFHDIAIVFDENPYILVVMSNAGEGSYKHLFSETSKLVGSLHEEYWKYKEQLCSNIKLY